MPPITEPATLRRPRIKGNAPSETGLSGTPTTTKEPSTLRSSRYGFQSIPVGTVQIISSEYPPKVGVPSWSFPLYVRTMPTAQYCSSPFLHWAHFRHESTKHPTPTLSPTLYFVTLFPTALTTPAISCPGTMGKIEPPHSS